MDGLSEICRIDDELRTHISKSPKLAETYKQLMGEELDRVVILPRMPTAADWEAAERLARSRT